MSANRLLESSDLVASLGMNNLVVQNLWFATTLHMQFFFVVSASSKIFITVLPKLNDATGWFFFCNLFTIFLRLPV